MSKNRNSLRYWKNVLPLFQ